LTYPSDLYNHFSEEYVEIETAGNESCLDSLKAAARKRGSKACKRSALLSQIITLGKENLLQKIFQTTEIFLISLIQCSKRYGQFPCSTENAERNHSDGRNLFMLIFSRRTMKISEKA
jgi:hypothetical protein